MPQQKKKAKPDKLMLLVYLYLFIFTLKASMENFAFHQENPPKPQIHHRKPQIPQGALSSHPPMSVPIVMNASCKAFSIIILLPCHNFGMHHYREKKNTRGYQLLLKMYFPLHYSFIKYVFWCFLFPRGSRVSWVDGSGVGFSLDYPSISLHAISRDLSAYPAEHLYMQVNSRHEGRNAD